MVTLYVKTGCPYCIATLGKVNELGLDIIEKNVSEEGNLNELLEKGGKKQVPFMVDDTNNISLYESSDIIEHLNKYYEGGEEMEESEIEAPGACPA